MGLYRYNPNQSSLKIWAHKIGCKAIKEQMGELSNLTPQTPTENRLFDMVSITAGVCEEILQLERAPGQRSRDEY